MNYQRDLIKMKTVVWQFWVGLEILHANTLLGDANPPDARPYFEEEKFESIDPRQGFLLPR